MNIAKKLLKLADTIEALHTKEAAAFIATIMTIGIAGSALIFLAVTIYTGKLA